MASKIAIIKETTPSEKRVAATPESIKKLIALGFSVTLEKGAGKESSYLDKSYQDAGAEIAETSEQALKEADIILTVQIPTSLAEQTLKKGAVVIGLAKPHENKDLFKKLSDKGLTVMAMEMVPRITRAQSMDVLSSQSNLAGYKAVLDATEYFNRAFPMMMTAAGTIAPAKVFVMGAGVAGLQAIATARRLGAIVSATDVRPAAKEQVKSLGASFVAVEDDEFKEAESAGGYAKEMSKEYQAKQADLVKETIAKQDIVITTALIPGRPAPKLISEEMIKSMKPGSVIVDMAVEAGGNVALSKLGKVVTKHDVTIIGHENIAGRLATDASALYAKNLLNLVTLCTDKETQSFKIDLEDDVIKGITITHDGNIIHPLFTDEKAPTKNDKE
ncbi:MAG TPA: Re/Si-specific NAD(P)(+) transhydrogenase subunit alpha [Alphaproteobacteria bacterium]|nr:Re/Si-specific NAD(P)(+) transhydrogenase subunit alpha [Alphaproteobacteria bacterium]